MDKCKHDDCFTCPYADCISDRKAEPKKRGRKKLDPEELRQRRNARARHYHETHKEEHRAYMRKYYAEHKEAWRTREKRYRMMKALRGDENDSCG